MFPALKPSDLSILLKTINLASRPDVDISITETTKFKFVAEYDAYNDAIEIHIFNIAEEECNPNPELY